MFGRYAEGDTKKKEEENQVLLTFQASPIIVVEVRMGNDSELKEEPAKGRRKQAKRKYLNG